MKKLLALSLAAIMMTAAVPTFAAGYQDWDHDGWHGHHGDRKVAERIRAKIHDLYHQYEIVKNGPRNYQRHIKGHEILAHIERLKTKLHELGF